MKLSLDSHKNKSILPSLSKCLFVDFVSNVWNLIDVHMEREADAGLFVSELLDKNGSSSTTAVADGCTAVLTGRQMDGHESSDPSTGAT